MAKTHIILPDIARQLLIFQSKVRHIYPRVGILEGDLFLARSHDRNKYCDRESNNSPMGAISKKGKLFLGKNGNRLPKSARRSRKPLQKDWATGRRPPSLRSAGKSAKYRLKPRRSI